MYTQHEEGERGQDAEDYELVLDGNWSSNADRPLDQPGRPAPSFGLGAGCNVGGYLLPWL